MKKMKYLFFDLEFASSMGGVHSICEFGYVVVDKNFQILEKNNLIINPNISNAEWDYRALKTLLTRKKNKYEYRATFDKFYSLIAKIIQDADIVLGHSLDGDAKALNDDCIRYNLPSIDFDFYDIMYFYQDFKNSNDAISLTNILEELEVESNPNFHDAEADAENTMQAVKAILNKLEMSLEDLISVSPSSKNRNENFIISGIEKSNKRNQWIWEFQDFFKNGKDVILHGKWQEYLLTSFIQTCEKSTSSKQVLDNKSIYLSINKEKTKLKPILSLVQFAVDAGAKIVLNKKECDILVKNNSADDSKLDIEKLNKERTKPIEIINYDDFYKLLGISSSILKQSPLVNFDCLWNVKDSKMFRRLQPAFNILNPSRSIVFNDLPKKKKTKQVKNNLDLNIKKEMESALELLKK